MKNRKIWLTILTATPSLLVLTSCNNNEVQTSNNQSIWESNVLELENKFKEIDEEYHTNFSIEPLYYIDSPNVPISWIESQKYNFNRDDVRLQSLRNIITRNKATLIDEKYKIEQSKISPTLKMQELIKKLEFIIQKEEMMMNNKYYQEIIWSTLSNLLFNIFNKNKYLEDLQTEIGKLSDSKTTINVEQLYLHKFVFNFFKDLKILEKKTNIIIPVDYNMFWEKFQILLSDYKQVLKNQNQDFELMFKQIEENKLISFVEKQIEKSNQKKYFSTLEIMLKIKNAINDLTNKETLIWFISKLELNILIKEFKKIEDFDNENRNKILINSIDNIIKYYFNLEANSKINFPQEIDESLKQMTLFKTKLEERK